MRRRERGAARERLDLKMQSANCKMQIEGNEDQREKMLRGVAEATSTPPIALLFFAICNLHFAFCTLHSLFPIVPSRPGHCGLVAEAGR